MITTIRFLAVLLLVCVLPTVVLAGDLSASEITALSREDILENNELIPASGYLSTSQPDAEVLDLVAARGFVAVIDLRGESEDRGIDEQAAVESRGMRYVSLPIPSPEDATFENAAALEDVLAALGAEHDGPVLLHCYSGNRVGSLFALIANSQGESAKDALALGKRARLTRWEPEVRGKLGLK